MLVINDTSLVGRRFT